ncbi:MAG: YIP1 family protein [Clostridia bacterium]|nr:YIP1 family protein [Clostridia bacterium]
MKKLISVLCLLFVFLTVVSIPVGAARAYQTYTYSIDGQPLYSPDAYTAVKSIDFAGMGLSASSIAGLNTANDIVTDQDENVYIVDSENDRIVVLDRYYKFKFELKNFENKEGVPDKFHNPQGMYVTADRVEEGVKIPGLIYVCDTDASRILTFKLDGTFHSTIPKPESELFGDDSVYTPTAIAVDAYDRLFVVSSNTNEGVIVMTQKGEFTGFIGAQQTYSSLWDQIWRRFQTDEQRAKQVDIVSYPYNNIAINERGFVYVTIYHEDLASKMSSAITSKSKAGTYAPCKLLNPAGDEIMRRNGFWPPAGEIDFKSVTSNTDQAQANAGGVSRIIDVATGPEQTWTIVDSKRNKLYTYDYDGNLLFAFGDSGNQLGNLTGIKSIVYQGDALLVLDGSNNAQRLTVFRRTEYGDVLIQALRHQNDRQYDLAIEDWKEILMRNSNYDAAYIGIGSALFRSGDYEEALEYYKAAYDTENYSEAYKELRKNWMSRFFLLIPLVIVVVCVLVGKFLKYAAKINKKVSVSGKKPTFKEELLFVFHVMFHPFDGFWDLKHEKRGSLRAAFVFIGITIVSLFYRSVGTGYVMNPQGEYSTIFMQAMVVFVPVLLFAVANWCLTTLFDGEGNFKNIFIAIGYSLLPIALTMVPVTIFSNIVVSTETDILSLIMTLGFIWAAFLIFFGMMVTHGYSMGKNLGITLGTIAGMAFIMFLAVLFTSLVMDMVSFVTNIVSEVSFRV